MAVAFATSKQWQEDTRPDDLLAALDCLRIHQGGVNLLRLVNQIMDLTKLAANRYDLRRAPLNAGHALANAAIPHEARAAARDIALEVTYCPPGVMIDADESVLTAMIGHPLDNALAFTQPGSQVRL